MKIKVIGKIDLPKVIHNKERTYQFDRAFKHFSKRLLERYSISINFKQYKVLCKTKLSDTAKLERNSKSGILIVNEVTVLVVKREDGILITALPIKNATL